MSTKNSAKSTFLKQLSATLIVFFLSQLILGAFLIYQVAQKEITDQLQTIAKRVTEDITFNKGYWDTHRYNSDPELPGTYPLYVFTNDGFVIDRWRPIHGFLDTSDAKKLFSYQTPQTINTVTNQTWRILSQPIINNGQTFGVITVAYYAPQQDRLQEIDTRLQNNAAAIMSKIHIQHGAISTENLDIRDISYDVTFQIVDKYNQIITKNNNTNSIDRIPNFIDTSYIGTILQGPQMQVVEDNITHERFAILTKPIVNNQNDVIGTIVVGKSIAFIGNILKDYVIAESVVGIILICIATLLLLKAAANFARQSQTQNKKPEITSISFDKKTGVLHLDQNEIQLPYSTNQYYLTESLFSAPEKRWELDEILEKFGDVDATNWRKVYDAMIIINKKVSEFLDEKLITVKDKTYQLNPQLLSKIH